VRGGIAKIIPSVKLTLMLPSDVMLKINVHLFSPALGRIPKGAYQKFIGDLVNEFFARANTLTKDTETNADTE